MSEDQLAGLPHLVDLGKLQAEFVGTVTLPDGRTVPVRHLDGFGAHLLERLDQKQPVAVADVYAAAARHLPTLTLDEVKTLSVRMCGAVLGAANGMVRVVEQTAPKASAPRATAPGRPGKKLGRRTRARAAAAGTPTPSATSS